jgi:hypothetical protein
LLLFAALSLVVVNFLAVQSGGVGRLVVWALATVAVVFSLFDFANNHRVRRVPYLAQTAPAMPDLPDTFRNWLQARADQSKFSGRYPVYIVAAQGGGSYAAMHAAHFLSYMQARCPNFAHHLFAISGVSGGSVGAAAFAAAMKDAEHGGGVTIPDRGARPGWQDLAISASDPGRRSPLQAMGFSDCQQFCRGVEIFDRAPGVAVEARVGKRRRPQHHVRACRASCQLMAEPLAGRWGCVAVHASALT